MALYRQDCYHIPPVYVVATSLLRVVGLVGYDLRSGQGEK